VPLDGDDNVQVTFPLTDAPDNPVADPHSTGEPKPEADE
jgi:hypothetical protein